MHILSEWVSDETNSFQLSRRQNNKCKIVFGICQTRLVSCLCPYRVIPIYQLRRKMSVFLLLFKYNSIMSLKTVDKLLLLLLFYTVNTFYKSLHFYFFFFFCAVLCWFYIFFFIYITTSHCAQLFALPFFDYFASYVPPCKKYIFYTNHCRVVLLT